MKKQKAIKETLCIILGFILLSIALILSLPKLVYAEEEPQTEFFNGHKNIVQENLHNETKIFDENFDLPTLTILTPGLGGKASTWSNSLNKKENGVDEFCYDENSIIETLRRKNKDIKTYRAEFNKKYLNTNFKLFELMAPQKTFDSYKESIKTSFTNADFATSTHFLVAFDPDYEIANASHNEEYKYLHCLIDSLSYNIEQVTGKVPRVNLIAHSRGGLLNMMYALDHPYNVNQMFSMGTPYLGSNMCEVGRRIDVRFPQLFQNIEFLSFVVDMVRSEGGIDCTNPAIYHELRDRWNSEIVDKNIDIELHAIGSQMNLSYLSNLMPEFPADILVKGIIDVVISNPIIFKFLSNVSFALDIGSIVMTLFDQYIEDGKYDGFSELVNGMITEFLWPALKLRFNPFRFNWDLILEDDFFIDYKSQTGQGSIGEAGYKNFIRHTRIFDWYNTDAKKLSTSTPFPAGHILEARDDQIINIITRNIKLGVTEPVSNIRIIDQENCAYTSLNTYPDHVVIPETIDGYKVKEIDREVFKDAKNVQSITIPNTVVSIGQSAFESCTGLKSINIPDSVVNIEESAFYGCNSLTNIEVGANNQYYSSYNGSLYNKDKTVLYRYAVGQAADAFTVPETVTKIGSYAFQENQTLQTLTLPESLTDIGGMAFYQCSALNTLIGGNNVKAAGMEAFEGTPWLINQPASNNFVLLGKTLIKYIGSEADISTLPVGVEAIADGAFQNSSITSVVLPDGVQSIGDFAFFACTELNKVIIPKSTRTIGLGAFRFNTGLKELNIYANTVPELGPEALNNTCDELVINVPQLYKEQYQAAQGWQGYSSKMQSLQYTISFDPRGGSSVDPITINYYGTFTNLPEPTWVGRRFAGWFDEADNVPYGNGSVWPHDRDGKLYAKWDKIPYAIQYELDGGTNDDRNPLSYTIGTDKPLYPAYRENYVFLGWFKDEALTQRKEKIASEDNDNLTLWAKWDGEPHTLTYQIDGVTYTENIKYGDTYTLPVPSAPGKYFRGWFDSNGNQYTYPNGFSKITEVTNDTVLIAQWEYSFQVKINAEGKIVWLGADGISTTPTSITIGREFKCPHCLIAAFKETEYAQRYGKYFCCFTEVYNDESTQLGCWSNNKPDYEDNEIVEIYAHFQNEIYEVYFSNGLSAKTLVYETEMDLYELNLVGKIHKGWRIIAYRGGSDLSDFEGKLDLPIRYNGNIDLSPGKGYERVSLEVEPILENKTFNVVLDNDNGTPHGDLTVTYDETFNITYRPTRIGYEFVGWYTERNAQGTKYAAADGASVKPWDSETIKTLYAGWKLLTYKIEYRSFRSNIAFTHTNPTTYQYTTSTFALSAPICDPVGYRFIGWVLENNPDVIITQINQYTVDDLILEAKWEGEVITSYNRPGSHVISRTVDNNGVAIIDLRTMVNNGWTSIYFYISSDMQMVTFWGKSDVVIQKCYMVFGEGISSVTVNLCHMNFSAPIGYNAMSFPYQTYGRVYLNTYGQCIIRGGNGADSTSTTGKGGNGSHGISAGMSLEITPMAFLQITGGTGGQGGAGTLGTNGEAGGWGNGWHSSGFDGEQGGAGGKGGIGGTGGYAILNSRSVQLSKQYTTEIYLHGGQGGRGGEGGHGGRGGNGGPAGDGAFMYPAGNGGNGGKGGAGGAGGDGGAGGKAYSIGGNMQLNCYEYAGASGLMGRGGDGGDGGVGGRGGKVWNKNEYRPAGAGGEGGVGGLGMPNGAKGRAGATGTNPG